MYIIRMGDFPTMVIPFDILFVLYQRAPIDVKIKLHRCYPILRHSVRKSVKKRLDTLKKVHSAGKVHDVTRPGANSTTKHEWKSGDYEFKTTRFSRVMILNRRNSVTGEVKETWSPY